MGFTVTVYSRFHSSYACRAVSRSTRGFGPGLRGAKGRPSRRSSIAIHVGLPSGRPMVGARSMRVVVAASAGMARSAAKSGIRARNGARVASSSSSPASCARARPCPKATLEQMARPSEASADGPGVAPVRFVKVARNPSVSGGVTPNGHDWQVDVIGHQAIGPESCAGSARCRGDQSLIETIVVDF